MRISLALAVVAAIAAPRAAHATVPIQLSTMSSTLLPDDCDLINVTITPHGSIPNTRLIQLQSDVTAWKAIDVPQAGSPPNQPYTEDQHRFSSSWMAAQFSTLTFEKAKFAGVHTQVYTLDVSSVPLGSAITFEWVQDSCPGFNGTVDSAMSHVPPSVAPGQTFAAQVAFFNVGQEWEPILRLQLVDPQGTWGVAPMTLASNVTMFDDATFTFQATAPTTPGVYHFTFVFGQQGGHSIATFDRQISVGVPPTMPPPPPKQTTVPNIVGKPLADAATALQAAQLQVGLAYDFDPMSFGPKTVISQGVPPNTHVAVNTAIDITVSDPGAAMGWAEFEAINCRRTVVQLWKANGDRFDFIANIAAGLRDNGTCDWSGGVTDQLTAGKPNWYLIVDPSHPGCARPDPANVDCVVFEWIGLGDPNGDTFSEKLE